MQNRLHCCSPEKEADREAGAKLTKAIHNKLKKCSQALIVLSTHSH